MRLIASLFLLIALSFNTPNICAHAAGMDELSAPAQMMMHDMSGHGHMSADTKMEHDMPEGQSNHCPDGCDGSENCQGCHAISPAVFSKADMGGPAMSDIVKIWVRADLFQATLPLDPPPPRPLS